MVLESLSLVMDLTRWQKAIFAHAYFVCRAWEVVSFLIFVEIERLLMAPIYEEAVGRIMRPIVFI